MCIRDRFSIGLYYLESKGRPLYNHPWRLSADGKINMPLEAGKYYGLASDCLLYTSRCV